MKKQDITSRLIDEIYGKIYALNDRLMRRSEKSKKNDEIYSCADIFDFYISSQAISFLKLLYIMLLGNLQKKTPKNIPRALFLIIIIKSNIQDLR